MDKGIKIFKDGRDTKGRFVVGFKHDEKTKLKISKTHKEKGSLVKHGLRRTRFYTIWANMKQRCLDKNKDNYKWYGGRGIKICDAWFLFTNFRNDMYKSYVEKVGILGEKNVSIDRIDNDDDYYKENCRWSTMKQQCNNRNNNIIKNGQGN